MVRALHLSDGDFYEY